MSTSKKTGATNVDIERIEAQGLLAFEKNVWDDCPARTHQQHGPLSLIHLQTAIGADLGRFTFRHFHFPIDYD